MSKCFEDNIEATELVLSIVLNKPDIKVIKVQTQYSIQAMCKAMEDMRTDLKRQEILFKIRRSVFFIMLS